MAISLGANQRHGISIGALEPSVGTVWTNDANSWDSGAVKQTYPGTNNWSDTSIDMQTVIDTTGLTGQLYVGVETAAGAIVWRAITVGASGQVIEVPTGPIR